MKVVKLLVVAVLLAGAAFAQSGTTCCKIDLAIVAPDGNGTFTVYHGGPGGITLPSGSFTVATGLNLQEALAAAGDDLYKSKGSQQSKMLIFRPSEEMNVSLTPHPPCPPTGPGNCKSKTADGPEPIPLCMPGRPCSVKLI